MKKKLLFVAVILAAFTMNAQFIVKDHDGNTVSDGAILEYSVATYPEASWDFFVHNTSATEDISMKILFESAVNADGSLMEICFGVCYTGITLGQLFPPGNNTFDIAPGENSGSGNHLYNAYDGTDIVEYVFKFYQVDASGNEIGEPLRVTYRYDPTLGAEDFNKLEVSIASTVISNEMIVTVQEEVQMNIYDLLGRKVKSQNLSAGQQVINMADLSTQAYIVQFNTESGKTSTSKIIVR